MKWYTISGGWVMSRHKTEETANRAAAKRGAETGVIGTHRILVKGDRVPSLSVYRVYNGWTGNGAVHRIVLAYTADDAIRRVNKGVAGDERPDILSAEWVCPAVQGAAELEWMDL